MWLVKDIYDLFTFFPGRIQDFQICREGDVSGCTGSIDDELTLIFIVTIQRNS